MLENPQYLRQIIEETGAHQTNLESPESAEQKHPELAAFEHAD